MGRPKNLEIWNRVSKTPSQDKKVGPKFTSINTQRQRKKATEMFGPEGHGWGTKNESFEFVADGYDNKYVFYRATFWYSFKVPGEEPMHGEFPINSTSFFGGDQAIYATKAVQTSAVKKALSRLGFNSDVFEETDEEDVVSFEDYDTKLDYNQLTSIREMDPSADTMNAVLTVYNVAKIQDIPSSRYLNLRSFIVERQNSQRLRVEASQEQVQQAEDDAE